MDVVHSRCAGMDISKKDAKVCVRVAGAGRRKTVETVTTWGSTTNQILALRDHLAAEQVSCVVMEATSDYWKPFYYLLEDLRPSGLVGRDVPRAARLRGKTRIGQDPEGLQVAARGSGAVRTGVDPNQVHLPAGTLPPAAGPPR
jgi:hypothetical protein